MEDLARCYARDCIGDVPQRISRQHHLGDNDWLGT